MNKILPQYITTYYKINLNNLDDELNNPKLTTLLNSNYNIISVIPVDDGGQPTAILILSNKNQIAKTNYLYISVIACITTLLHVALQYLTL